MVIVVIKDLFGADRTKLLIMWINNNILQFELDIGEFLYRILLIWSGLNVNYNYIDVYFLWNNTLTNRLIRNTLSNIDIYLSDIKEIIRCHKSYIINISYVKSIIGNSAGYKLNLCKLDFKIPVSRKYSKEVLNTLSHLN